MGKIWWSEMELFQRLMHLRKSDAVQLQRERVHHEAERRSLQAEIDDLKTQLKACAPRQDISR